MSLRIRCPSCKAINRVDEDRRGRKVRCSECDEPIRVPAEEDDGAAIQEKPRVKSRTAAVDDDDDRDDDRPRRRKKSKAAASGMPMMLLLIGGGALALIFVIGAVGLGAYFISQRADLPRPKGAQARLDKKRAAKVQDQNVIARGPIILNERGVLLATDPRDPTAGDIDSPMKVFQVQLQANKTYVIFMASNDFDAYLRIESPAGAELMEDDDGGGGLNARIVFRPNEAGNYRVIATTFDGDLGAFHVTVQEQ